MKTIIVIALIALLVSCKKEDSYNNFNDLKGIWYNSTTDFDAIIFQSEDSLLRKNLKSGVIHHYYDLELKSDELFIHYTGWDKCNVPGSTHKYYLNRSKDTLVIENLSLYYPFFEGNKFYRN